LQGQEDHWLTCNWKKNSNDSGEQPWSKKSGEKWMWNKKLGEDSAITGQQHGSARS
jgi:hypothetical protein